MFTRRSTLSAQLTRRIAGGLVVAVMASLAVATMPEQAWGESVQAQIDRANEKLEPIIEEYDRIASLLGTDQAKATALGTKANRASAQVSVARVRLQPIATQVYEFAPIFTLGALLDSTTTPTLVNRLSLAEEIAHRQHKAIGSLMAARDKYRAAKKVLDASVASLSKRKADLASKKRTILAQIASLERLEGLVLPHKAQPSISALRPVPCPYTPIGGAAAIAVRVACGEIGKPYVWAAAGPNTFDCSGLVLYAWGKAGKKLRHYTVWQWEDTTPITRAQLRPGDLVFFFPPTLHHVGMYVGGGWMVNAPHTGDVVRMRKIDALPIAGYRRP
jgi:cell wall-associated NlpC family hydrolase